MKFCNKNHELIAYGTTECPLCTKHNTYYGKLCENNHEAVLFSKELEQCPVCKAVEIRQRAIDKLVGRITRLKQHALKFYREIKNEL